MRLARVDGRSDDILVLPARGGGEVRVHPFRLRAPFVRLLDVLQYQVVQHDEGLLVRVVVSEAAARDVADRVRLAVQEALDDAGAVLPVVVEVVPAIERQAGHAGKLKLVVSGKPS